VVRGPKTQKGWGPAETAAAVKRQRRVSQGSGRLGKKGGNQFRKQVVSITDSSRLRWVRGGVGLCGRTLGETCRFGRCRETGLGVVEWNVFNHVKSRPSLNEKSLRGLSGALSIGSEGHDYRVLKSDLRAEWWSFCFKGGPDGSLS